MPPGGLPYGASFSPPAIADRSATTPRLDPPARYGVRQLRVLSRTPIGRERRSPRPSSWATCLTPEDPLEDDPRRQGQKSLSPSRARCSILFPLGLFAGVLPVHLAPGTVEFRMRPYRKNGFIQAVMVTHLNCARSFVVDVCGNARHALPPFPPRALPLQREREKNNLYTTTTEKTSRAPRERWFCNSKLSARR